MYHHSEGRGSFSIAYNGPGLVDGVKDVHDLAPAALLAVVSDAKHECFICLITVFVLSKILIVI